METLEYIPSLDDIPIPDELPMFVDAIECSEDSTSSELSSQSSPVHRGTCSSVEFDFEFTNPSRTTRITTQLSQLVRILKMFKRTGKVQTVKTQNLISQLARAFKRVIRDCKKLIAKEATAAEILGTRGIYKFSPKDGRKLELWNSILTSYCIHKEFFTLIFSEANKPGKNGKRFISYGTDYLAWMLSNVSVQVLWDKFVELVFEGKSALELCEKFNMSCCGSDCHNSKCGYAWAQLQQYLAKSVYSEIGVEKIARPQPQSQAQPQTVAAGNNYWEVEIPREVDE